jgi:hypothetical protein
MMFIPAPFWSGAAGGGGGPTGLVFYFAEVLPSPAESLQAPPTTERATFMARLTVSGSEGWESGVSLGDPMDAYAFTTNGVTATIGAASAGATFVDAAFDGLFNTTPGGTFYAQMSFDDGFGGFVPVTFTFSTPVAAFGCYLTDIGDFGGDLTVTLNKTGGGTVVHSVPSTSGTTGWLAFWGFVDDSSQTYDSIEMVSNDVSEAIAIDDVVMATFAQLA